VIRLFVCVMVVSKGGKTRVGEALLLLQARTHCGFRWGMKLVAARKKMTSPVCANDISCGFHG